MENINKKGEYCDAWYDNNYINDCRKSGCERCGISRNMQFKLFGKKFSVHHDIGNFNCKPNELMTLCSSCHPKRHKELRR